MKTKMLRGNNSPFMTKDLKKAIMNRSRFKNRYNKWKSRENFLNLENSGKYSFYSKYKQTPFKLTQPTTADGKKSKFAKDLQEKQKIGATAMYTIGQNATPMETKLDKLIPLSVGGGQPNQVGMQQIDKKLNRGVEGALNKFSTLSYTE